MGNKLIEFFGGVWVPDKPVPCQANPDQWSDPVYYLRDSVLQHEAITTCMYECPFRIMCLVSALREEGSAQTRERVGIRGGTLPKDRYNMYKKKKLKGRHASSEIQP